MSDSDIRPNMSGFLRYSSLLFLTTGISLAQLPTVDIYTTPSSDGVNGYATGVMQVSSSNMEFCNAQNCQRPTHTYTQTVTIKSPSGRSNSCTFNYSYLANVQFNHQCEAALAINGEYGDYPVQDEQLADCTFGGEFLNSNFNISLRLGVSINIYQFTAIGVNGECYYYPIANCNTRCQNSLITGPTPCYAYVLQNYGWFQYTPGPTGYFCVSALSTPTNKDLSGQTCYDRGLP
jgi:hypothetical protein